ncbi:hypothetical protein BN1012_Phect1810 [Candidatus Phaeomarinobacter ectocarpi]|uniref:Uncharacterized protein n=1 Tax=Candidatus Phaeomarinibacter ectocarpi TaxID=1458461 RepID=X5MFP3_9HYPH|nr:hypothetical protein [Candidatus Phaeomarinobacter ectocarpi]CDO60024.1 hypothetical protein BN1012_Phect1810 [Candidatus Phaeomarinobacter ectocarpi]
MKQKRILTPEDYHPGHPWYYLLGGTPPFPKQILERVKKHGYRGYKQRYIEEAAAKAEPDRSIALRAIKDDSRNSLFANLSRYREVARGLRKYRENPGEQPCFCSDVHQSVSLKHNHIYNDFAHLIWLDELLSEQRDLFDF